jgi:DNA-binding NarL/FixJ family response regulator
VAGGEGAGRTGGPAAGRGSLPPAGQPAGRLVGLARLLPVYRYGLERVLTTAGLRTCVIDSFADLHQPARPTDIVDAVVLPADQQPALLAATDRPLTAAVVVVLAELDSEPYARALRGGATAALTIDSDPDEVLEVVEAALRGRTLLPAPIAWALANGAGRADLPPEPFHPQEVDWLRRLAEGGTVASVARAAGHSEREMYRLLAGLYARIGADSRTEALLLAERWGLLTEPTGPSPPVSGHRAGRDRRGRGPR